MKYIDSKGTLKADSLFGIQSDIVLTPELSVTAQVVARSALERDKGVDADFRWAFMSYRPSNDLLIRVGRLRVPFFFGSQNSEVGVTYDLARFPPELHSVSPVYDADGLAFTRTWTAADFDITLDGYVGQRDIKFRNPVPAVAELRLSPEPYIPEKVKSMGLILSGSAGSLRFMTGYHNVKVSAEGAQQFVEGFTPLTIAAPPPFGGTLYVPGNVIGSARVNVFTAGIEWDYEKWKITGEYARRSIRDTKLGVASQSFASTVAFKTGRWTPYFTYARLLSARETRDLYHNLVNTPVPSAVTGPPLFLSSNTHLVFSSQVFVYDQYSIITGSSFELSQNSKVKLELMRTKVGLASVLTDGGLKNKSFNVLSVSYSFAF